jgi:CMP-2-keto-3-deoxyoctulosonic acid synthetase
MSKTWTLSAFMVVVVLLAPLWVPAVPVTESVFADSEPSTGNNFVGATFVPSVAPLVTVVVGASTTALSWSPVVFTGSEAVSYVVRRIAPNGSTVIVCTGADTPVLQADGLMHCVDREAAGRRNLSYSQQPVVVRNGTVTWSLEPSTPVRG